MASNQEKVIEYLTARLKDKRPDVRLNAITELEAMGANAAAALDALQQCYESAEEEDVKSAAQKAGYSIFVATKSKKSSN